MCVSDWWETLILMSVRHSQGAYICTYITLDCWMISNICVVVDDVTDWNLHLIISVLRKSFMSMVHYISPHLYVIIGTKNSNTLVKCGWMIPCNINTLNDVKGNWCTYCAVAALITETVLMMIWVWNEASTLIYHLIGRTPSWFMKTDCSY